MLESSIESNHSKDVMSSGNLVLPLFHGFDTVGSANLLEFLWSPCSDALVALALAGSKDR